MLTGSPGEPPIVDQDVDAAETFHTGIDGFLDGRRVGHVAGGGEADAAFAGDDGAGFLDGGRVDVGAEYCVWARCGCRRCPSLRRWHRRR
jgi:hypothetical protein